MKQLKSWHKSIQMGVLCIEIGKGNDLTTEKGLARIYKQRQEREEDGKETIGQLAMEKRVCYQKIKLRQPKPHAN